MFIWSIFIVKYSSSPYTVLMHYVKPMLQHNLITHNIMWNTIIQIHTTNLPKFETSLVPAHTLLANPQSNV